jgi:hypothetical protein
MSTAVPSVKVAVVLASSGQYWGCGPVCALRTSTVRCGVRYRALQYITSLTVCFLTDACKTGLQCAASSAVSSALLSLHSVSPNTQNLVPVGFLHPDDARLNTLP